MGGLEVLTSPEGRVGESVRYRKKIESAVPQVVDPHSFAGPPLLIGGSERLDYERTERLEGTHGRSSGAERKSKRIAILDDNSEFAWASSKALQRRGYDAVGVTSENALRTLSSSSSNPFEFAVIDYRLGHGDNGVEVGARVLRTRPRARVIITSADDSILDQVIASGMKFLLKPFTIDELIRLLVDGQDSFA